jgi:hypothetical protein
LDFPVAFAVEGVGHMAPECERGYSRARLVSQPTIEKKKDSARKFPDTILNNNSLFSFKTMDHKNPRGHKFFIDRGAF